MSSSKQPNEVFEIIPAPQPDVAYGYSLKFKGRTLHPEIIAEIGNGFQVAMPPEQFLDFDASLLPEGFSFWVLLPERKCMDLLDMVTFERIEDEISLHVCFSGGSSDTPPDLYLNEHKLLTLFYELAVDKGYEIMYDPAHRDIAQVQLVLPAKGNLYKQYKKHLAVFESLFALAADEMIKKMLAK